VALAQVNSTVGDLGGNTEKIVDWMARARRKKADLVVFPELALTGYPPEDLLLKPSFIRDNLRQLDQVVAASKGIAAVVGFVDLEGQLIARAPSFAEELLIADLDIGSVFGERLHDTRLRREAQGPIHVELELSDVTVTEKPRPAPEGKRLAPVTEPLEGVAEVY